MTSMNPTLFPVDSAPYGSILYSGDRVHGGGGVKSKSIIKQQPERTNLFMLVEGCSYPCMLTMCSTCICTRGYGISNQVAVNQVPL